MENISLDFVNMQLNEPNMTMGLQNFNIDKKIGNGQFSMVFKAKHLSTNQDVALKKVHNFEMMDSKHRMDCIKEINILKDLSHPNVIQYIASFIEDNKLFILLELADGGDLGKLIIIFRAKKRLFGEITIWRYFYGLCSAVQHMHSKRIMHRDIKPANVFITSKGIVKLGDLGLGRYFSSETVAAHTIVGTPYYMSPERIHEKGYDFKSDIWSMGCLLYEMAALQSPFFSKNTNLVSLRKRIQSCYYPPVPSDKYSHELYSLIDKCLQSSPGKRPDIDSLFNVSEAFAKCLL